MANLDKDPQIEYVCYELVGRKGVSYIRDVVNVMYDGSHGVCILQDANEQPVVMIPLSKLLELRIKYKD